MSRTVFTALACVFLATTLTTASPQLDLTLKHDVLADGIHLFRAPSDLDRWTATNVVAIVNDSDVVVFDSNTLPSTSRLVIAEIRKITNKPVRTLINSHWHMDHWSGNDEFVKAYPGLQIISTVETRDFMKRMTANFFAESAGPAGSPFAEQIRAIPRVLPTMVFRDAMTFWSGSREFRLFTATGDATGSAVMYLPQEKLLITGDVLVAQEEGNGPPAWSTNSNAVTPWLKSLRDLDALDAGIIVPGQGAAFHDKVFLRRTIALYASVIGQVHAALERGLVTLEAVQAAVNVDAIGKEFSPGATAPVPDFTRLVGNLVRKSFQEALDSAGREKR